MSWNTDTHMATVMGDMDILTNIDTNIITVILTRHYEITEDSD